MSAKHSEGPVLAHNPQQLRAAATDLLVSLQENVEALRGGPENSRQLAPQLQLIIDEIRQALGSFSDA